MLAADGVATWTDPTGRTRSTPPVDALHTVVLTGAAAAPATTSTSRPRTVLPDGPHSSLEFVHEHLVAALPAPAPTWRDERGRRCADVEAPGHGIRLLHRPRRPHRSHRPGPAGARRHDGEPPPF